MVLVAAGVALSILLRWVVEKGKRYASIFTRRACDARSGGARPLKCRWFYGSEIKNYFTVVRSLYRTGWTHSVISH